MLRRVAALALLASLPAACGSGGASPDATSACSFAGALPRATKAAPASASVEDMATAQGLMALDAFLRPYLLGEITVYKGTLAAHDNQGVLNGPMPSGASGFENQSVDAGAAVASLAVTDGNAVLSVHSLSAHMYVVFTQTTKNPSKTTDVGIILADSKSGGNTGTCTSCVPAFTDQPTTIDFSNIKSTQVVNLDSFGGGNDDVTLHTFATASLERVEPCAVAFADVAELNSGQGLSFTLNAGEWTAELSGYGYGSSGCPTPYTIELYVNASNLADYGVRNYAPGESMGCYP
jgi:hypothetical protein